MPILIETEALEGHDAGPPVDPRDPLAVVALGGYGAGDVRAVIVTVSRIVDRGVVVVEVPAVDVIDITVVVVVFAYDARGFFLVGPDIVPQIRMGHVHARVYDRHRRARVPGLGGVCIRVEGAAGLARVVEAVEFAVPRIVRRCLREEQEVRFGVLHIRGALVASDGLPDRSPGKTAYPGPFGGDRLCHGFALHSPFGLPGVL